MTQKTEYTILLRPDYEEVIRRQSLPIEDFSKFLSGMRHFSFIHPVFKSVASIVYVDKDEQYVSGTAFPIHRRLFLTAAHVINKISSKKDAFVVPGAYIFHLMADRPNADRQKAQEFIDSVVLKVEKTRINPLYNKFNHQVMEIEKTIPKNDEAFAKWRQSDNLPKYSRAIISRAMNDYGLILTSSALNPDFDHFNIKVANFPRATPIRDNLFAVGYPNPPPYGKQESMFFSTGIPIANLKIPLDSEFLQSNMDGGRFEGMSGSPVFFNAGNFKKIDQIDKKNSDKTPCIGILTSSVQSFDRDGNHISESAIVIFNDRVLQTIKMLKADLSRDIQ